MSRRPTYPRPGISPRAIVSGVVGGVALWASGICTGVWIYGVLS